MSAKTKTYFSDCLTIEALKKLYRQLVRQYHPDLCGDDQAKTAEYTKIMQVINAEYTAKLQRMDGQTSQGTDGREHTYRYDAEIEQDIMDKLQELIGLNLPDDVEIWLIGTWIWVKGETKPHKELLKESGCKWHSKRSCWYWQNNPYKSFYNKSGLDSLASKYGASKFKNGKADDKKRRKAPQLNA